MDVPGRVSKLLQCGKKVASEKLNPRQVTKNCVALIEVTVEAALPLELYSDLRALGRVSLRRGGETVAVGVVMKLVS